MTIIVTNKYRPEPARSGSHTTIYCGRGSALGNPFKMVDANDRERVCNNYDSWLPAMLISTDDAHRIQRARMEAQLANIMQATVDDDVHLQCFCAPLRCHCETIKRVVERRMKIKG